MLRVLIGPKLAPVTPAGMKLIAHGNSYVFGSLSSDTAHNFLSQSLLHGPLLGSGLTWDNRGVGGMTISVGSNSMIATAPTTVDPNLVSGKLNVLLIWDGINEIANNSLDGTSAFAKYKVYYAARKAAARAAGKRTHIVLLTSIPCWYGTSSSPYDQSLINTHNAQQVILNNLIRAEGRGQACDSIIDIAANPGFTFGGASFPDYQQSRFNASPYYDHNDFIHPNNAGHALIGQIVGDAFRQCRRYA